MQRERGGGRERESLGLVISGQDGWMHACIG
jgi:hypothetical protein